MPSVKKIFLITGELSGESHIAKVVYELLKTDPTIEIRAMGSDALRELGANVIVDYRNYSFTGLTEVVLNILKILKLKNTIITEIKKFEPDALVLVDYAGFNLEIAKTVCEEYEKYLGTEDEFKKPKIIEYIAPQLWASRPYRIKKIKKYIDKVLCTLPFEENIYLKENIPVRYVGNPVMSSLIPQISKKQFLEEFIQISGSKEPISQSTGESDVEKEFLIGMFPGSRKSEIKYILPIMMQAAKLLKDKEALYKVKYRFVLARALTISKYLLYKYGLDDSFVQVLEPGTMDHANHKLLCAADMLWLCSGTVTLEAALYKTPYFLTYRGNWINYTLYKFLRIIDKAGLANIIAGKYIVKEFLQYDATAENFVNETEAWLNLGETEVVFSDYYKNIKAQLLELKKILKEYDTPKIVAEEIINLLAS